MAKGFPTKDALRVYFHTPQGVLRSLLHPSKRVVKGVLKHTKYSELIAESKFGSSNQKAIEREEGKYAAPRISNLKSEKLMLGIFGKKHKRLAAYEQGMNLHTRLF